MFYPCCTQQHRELMRFPCGPGEKQANVCKGKSAFAMMRTTVCVTQGLETEQSWLGILHGWETRPKPDSSLPPPEFAGSVHP